MEQLKAARADIEALKSTAAVTDKLLASKDSVIDIQQQMLALKDQVNADKDVIISQYQAVIASYKDLVVAGDTAIAALKKKTGKAGIIFRCGTGAAAGAALGASGGPLVAAGASIVGCVVGVLK